MILSLSEEEESAFQGDQWKDVAQDAIDVTKRARPGEYVIWAGCEYAGHIGGTVEVRLLLDEREIAFDHFNPIQADKFRCFSVMVPETLTDGFYYLTLQARCLDPTQTVKVRRKRMLVMRH